MTSSTNQTPGSEFHPEGPDAEELKQVRGELQALANASAALQETVDALAKMPSLGQFTPEVLRIAARAFSSDHCFYLENCPGGPIQLKYWFLSGSVLDREEIFDLEDKYDYMKRLAKGFTVEDSYFGMPFRKRTRASVIDHGVGDRTSPDDIDCRLHGWYLELNVPVVVNGSAVGELVVQRGPGMAYTPAEIALGERLATHLSVAEQVGRLSVEANGAAVAQEKERAALERAKQIESSSAALRRTLDSLVCEADFLAFLDVCLKMPRNNCRHRWLNTGESMKRILED